jgi:hypothetical protein
MRFRSLMVLLAFSVSAEASLDCDLQMGVGYRQDSLNFSIAAPSGSPNILSELTWTDLKTFQIMAISRLTANYGFYMRVNGDYGWILSGRNRDSDYNGDDRTLEFSRSVSDSDGGSVYDVSVGFGRASNYLNDSLKIVPLLGFSAHGQNLILKNGLQVISDNPSLLGPFEGLNSSYRTTWYGPWIGLDVFWAPSWSIPLSFWGSAEYHRTWYHARGHWNLRSDFADDFHNESCANGFVGMVGIDYDLGCNWLLNLVLCLQEWRAEAGIDRTTFFVDELSDTSVVGFTKLNGAHWHSWSASASLTKIF